VYDAEQFPLSPALSTALNDLRNHSAVQGVLLDVNASPRVRAAKAQAAANFGCVYATQLVATSIRDLVRSYANLNADLRYVVLVGGDDSIPFFRYPDLAEIETEDRFTPPVDDQTAAQAALRRGFLLTQDPYGAFDELTIGPARFPISDLAVGRLAETESEILAQINAFLTDTNNGVVATPTNALVTGYDFLADGAEAVAAELDLGLNRTSNRLIAPRTCSPTEPCAWTAQDLRDQLTAARYDLLFLSRHFNPYGALAADFTSELSAADLATAVANQQISLRNTIIFSGGCHSGYNVPGTSLPSWNDPNRRDFVQVFAGSGATLIANPGYQYGEVSFIDYGERLYLEFSRALRTGSGPVSVGDALLNAKRAYLAGLGDGLNSGIEQKSLLISTLYGLPMLAIDMPGERIIPTNTAIVGSADLQAFSSGPAAAVGLGYADETIDLRTSLNTTTITLVEPTDENPRTQEVTAIAGSNNRVLARHGEPVLPLEQRDVTVDNRPLRGVVFLGGSYTDLLERTPLVATAVTELHTPRPRFVSPRFFPATFWRVNTFDTLFDPSAGRTRLNLLPAQFRSDTPNSTTGTLRRYDELTLRLYYGDLSANFISGDRLQAGPPVIASVAANSDGSSVAFDTTVIADPSAGVQEVFITWTDGAGTWRSLALSQNPLDTTRWQGNLALDDITGTGFGFIVQAVSGVGLVAVDDNDGDYYGLTVDTRLVPTPATARFLALLELDPLPAEATYNSAVTVSATLTARDLWYGSVEPLADQTVRFTLGGLTRTATTDANGRASVSVPLSLLPGSYRVGVSYAGGDDISTATAIAETAILITSLATELTISPAATITPGSDTTIVATLRDENGAPIFGASIYLIVVGETLAQPQVLVRRSDFLGQVRVGQLDLPVGNYTIQAYFSGAIPNPVNLTLEDPYYLPALPVQANLTIEEEDPGIIWIPLITKGPNPVTGDTVATFEFSVSGEENLSFVCSLDGAAFVPCTSPLRITDLSIGDHTFAVKAVGDSRAEQPAATYTWTVQQLYRARQVGERVWIERNIALANMGDSNGNAQDGWALIGRTNGAADNGELCGFYVEDNIPYVIVYNRSKNRGDRCILLAPRTLVRVQPGQTRLLDKLQDPVPCSK
jgi:hypothetical protein